MLQHRGRPGGRRVGLRADLLTLAALLAVVAGLADWSAHRGAHRWGMAGMRFVGTNASGYREFLNEQDGSVGIVIPGGSFTFGDGGVCSGPPRVVTLPAYWIGKYDVTNAQYRRFVKTTGYRSAGDWWQYARRWGERSPVVEVSWNDAVAYAQWAGLRLPTEQEWEKAARGTDGRRYPWGNAWDARRCRNGDRDGHNGVAPVGSYPSGASPCGCLDMAGNVWQWTASLYDGGQDLRVLRGGSWYSVSAGYFRAAFRYGVVPGNRGIGVGYRAARSL